MPLPGRPLSTDSVSRRTTEESLPCRLCPVLPPPATELQEVSRKRRCQTDLQTPHARSRCRLMTEASWKRNLKVTTVQISAASKQQSLS